MYSKKHISHPQITMTADYGDKTPTIQNAQLPARAIMQSVVSNVITSAPQTIKLADYGSANGDNSQPMWVETLTRLTQQLPSSRIHICHNDLNFSNLRKLTENQHTLSEISPAHIQTSAKQISYLAPLFTPNSIQIGFSSFALHWKSSPLTPTQELDHFFSLRHQELVPGGELVMVNIVHHDEGESHHSQAFYDTAKRLWQDLPDSQRKEELVYPVVFRTPSDFISQAKAAGFEVVQDDCSTLSCAVYDRYLTHQNPHQFAEEITSYVFSWGECCLRDALTGSDSEKDAIIRQLRENYQKEAKENPAAFQNRLTLHYLRLKKPIGE